VSLAAAATATSAPNIICSCEGEMVSVLIKPG
jgi:hypothetical protein